MEGNTLKYVLIQSFLVTTERWEQIKIILESCLERAPDERPGYLTEVCGTDSELRVEVESLLESYEEVGDLLEEPALGPREPEAEPPGRRVGVYRLVEEIGEGGMARVYLGMRADDAFRKKVAIKLVKRGMDHEFILRRFRHERQIMASLEHPNIARLLDGGTTEDGTPYFVMEYIQGRPIDEHCNANQLSIEERLELIRTVCSAVHYAHQKRIIHRDIKPGNILITADGVPKLLDFGIAKILNPETWTETVDATASVLRLMTPDYASPEQVRGEPVSERSDIYSLGVLLYELLCGHKPYRPRSRAPHDIAHAICDYQPERPSTMVGRVEHTTRPANTEPVEITPEAVGRLRSTHPDRLRRRLSGDLDNIVLTALRKEPDRRYASAAQLSEDIRRHLEGLPVSARKDTLFYRTGKLLSRHKSATAVTAALVLCVSAGLAIFNIWAGRENPLLRGSSTPPLVVPFTSFPGTETQPAFSPDEKKIAFVWGGENNDNFDIYIQPVDGGALQRLTTDPAEDVSPAWSPDGKRLAFIRTKNGHTAVFVSPAEGGVHGMIAELYANRIEAVGRHLDWSRDGRYLAVADKTSPEEPFSIFLIEASTGRKQRLTLPPERIIGDSNPAFSPDGKSLSFLRSPSSGVTELFVKPLESGEVRALTRDHRSILSQAWTPDSSAIVFSSNRTGATNLWIVPAGGGPPRRVPGISEGTSEPTFSRTSGKIAFTQSFLDTNIWAIDLRSGTVVGAPRKIVSSTMYDSSAQISPDGTRIAFRSSRSGFNEIWIAGRNGEKPRQLTNFGGPLTGTPRWSPDSRWVAFDTRPEGQADIYIIPADGGIPRRITFETSEDVVPSWSHDGKSIYFASNRSGAWQVWKAPVDGGPKVQVTRNGGFAAFESRDGQYVYYAKGRGVPGLCRVPTKGGIEETILETLKPGYWGYWEPGREGIYFMDTAADGRAGLFFIPYSGGSVRRLTAIGKPLIPADSAFAVSPDERLVLYTQVDQSGSDIMLAEIR